jgi:hypothetical protein
VPPKLHHHLPQSYQEGFCRDGRLFVFDRVTGTFRRDQPKNVAAITHDYTLYRDGNVKDTKVETFLAEVDGTAVPISKKLRDRIPLTADERESFAWYLAFFAVRVPRFRRWLSEAETARRKRHDREHLQKPEQLQNLIDNSDLTDTERAEANAELIFEMLKSEDYVVTVGHDYGIRLLVEAGCDLMPKVHDLFWIVAHVAEGAEFITSDNPLVQIGANEAMTFPVAADTALMLMQAPSGKIHNYDIEMPADLVHETNVATARECERLVLARDEDYLRRVVEEAGIVGTTAAPLIDIGPPSAPA